MAMASIVAFNVLCRFKNENTISVKIKNEKNNIKTVFII